MKKIIILITIITLFCSCNKTNDLSQINNENEKESSYEVNDSNYIEIKYGNKVDIGNKRFGKYPKPKTPCNHKLNIVQNTLPETSSRPCGCDYCCSS